jgi:tetrahydromethanopterin S-methyltransferase subunit B
MPKITQRDIAESIVGIRVILQDLRNVAQTSHRGMVTIKVDPLMRHIAFLDQVVEELMTLVSDDPVKVPID